MEAIQFIGTTPDNLIDKIKSAVVEDLTSSLSKEFQPKQPTRYLTRAEVCELLQIDLSTLHRWRKDGILKAYGIANRVYFKREEIDNLINENQLI